VTIIVDTLVPALAWTDAGCCVVQARIDGSKRPALDTWTEYQHDRPARGVVERWFGGGHPGVGLICGKVSGGLEMLELEGRAITEGAYERLFPVLREVGVLDIWKRLLDGYAEDTPGGGIHLLYRIADHDVPGNTKVASRPTRPHELTDERIRVLAETRGEGGFVIVAPSSGSTHPTGKPWTLCNGSRYGRVPTLTWEERCALHRVIRAVLDETPELGPRSPPQAGEAGDRPGDHWAAKTTWVEILEPHGWRWVYQRGGMDFWRRPGKERGISARTGGAFDGLYVWSSSTEFDTEVSITKFRAYAVLEHRGDDSAAATALRRQGYGASPPSPGAEETSDSQSASSTEQALPRLSLTPASAVVIKRVCWGWRDRMPVGELTLVPGREGVGKSLLLAWLAAELTKGTLDGEFLGTPRAVLYVASEDSWNYTIAPRMKAAGADLDMVYRVDVVDNGRLSLPADCNDVARLAVGKSAAAVMLDPVISLIHSSLNVNQASELRQALEPLRRTAENAGLILPALAHFNKTTDTDVLSKIPGSRAWAEVARAAFGVAEDRDAGGYVGSQIKNNLGRLDLPNLTYRIEGVLIDAVDGKADVGRLVWTGVGDAGVEEVLGRKPEKRARDTSDTTKMIEGYIEECGYPMLIKDIYAQFPQLNRNTVRQSLKRSWERGTLSKPAEGIYGPGEGQ
jgi:putative DNA primase/helicase